MAQKTRCMTLDACVLMMARDAEDYITPCVMAVAPHVKRVRIFIDSRSKDNTYAQALTLMARGTNIEMKEFKIENPRVDLVAIRNAMMGFPEKWGWIVDSDEYHYEIPELENDDAYAFS